MSEVRICGVYEVPEVIERFKIKRLLSCMSNYKIVETMYNLTSSVKAIDPNYWSIPENWLKLNMEDTAVATKQDAPTMEEVVKGITFGRDSIKSGNNLLVHCQLGLSRSPAMAIGSMIYAGDSIENAFSKAKNVRSRIDPNPLIIELIDKFLNLNGELSKYNNDTRVAFRKELLTEYRGLMESYVTDVDVLSVILENVSALNSL